MRTEAMNPQLIEAIIGCLLHDIGKPVQRAALGYPGRHSAIGRAFMKKVWLRDSRNPSQFTDEVDEADIGVSDRRILDAISYHHSSALRTAAENGRLAADAPAYIAYIADNIAAGTDRRKADSDDGHGASTWDPDTPLYSMFNRFGSGTANLAFAPEMLDDRKPINIPSPRRIEFDKDRYAAIVNKLKAILVDLERSDTYLASLLNVLEATLSFVPSSTDASEVVDVSLFDHLKLTGALGACIWHYLQATGQSDFKSALFDKQDTFYNEKAFLLTTFDVSGIQDFIYTIHSSGAAKMLRARSFYLEMLTEHLIDELLARVGLSRANLNYSGGGHAYLLLPNTESARKSVEQFEREANDWLLEARGAKTLTEVKFENAINRVTAKANLRQMERVIPGSEFAFSLVYEVSFGTPGEEQKASLPSSDEIIEDFNAIARGLKLLELDYLGGSGTRGYGQVKFSNLKARAAVGALDGSLLEKLNHELAAV